ncbi:MAG: HAD-IIB family hydrolase [Pseudomonadales bacterium]
MAEATMLTRMIDSPPAPGGWRELATMAPTQTLIFTDLDGTLLDDDYDLQGAAGAMDAMQEHGAVVIPVSSKTLPELRELAALRNLQTPLIFENGAGIAWPLQLAPSHLDQFSDGYAIELCGQGYEPMCELLSDLRQRNGYRFQGFADFTDAQVAAQTGLTVAGAALARQRMASEPLCWRDDPGALQQFRRDLEAAALTLTRGGRFYHVMPTTNKGAAAARVVAAYRQTLTGALRTVACGDSPNDLALLEFADACALFPRPDCSYLSLPGKALARAPRAGTRGWLTTVTALLAELGDE